MMDTEIMEKLQLSLQTTHNSFREESAASFRPDFEPNTTHAIAFGNFAPYCSSTSSDSTNNQEKEHVTQLLSDLKIYHGDNRDVGPLEEQELHKPPKGSSEDELLLLIENFRHLEECLEGTVEKMKVIFPSSDSEYVDAWEMTCRGIKRLQEGLSIISEAKKLMCPPIVNHYPQDY